MAIEATVKVKLKPWNAPNFASPEVEQGKDAVPGIPVRDLDEDALAAMAQQWLDDLYVKTDHQCPFTKREFARAA